jgi:hypothetical protein
VELKSFLKSQHQMSRKQRAAVTKTIEQCDTVEQNKKVGK